MCLVNQVCQFGKIRQTSYQTFILYGMSPTRKYLEVHTVHVFTTLIPAYVVK